MDDLTRQLERTAERLTRMANSQTVTGRPIEQGAAVAIPLCEVTFAFGGALGSGRTASGNGEGKGGGAGVAGGLTLRPKAVLVVDATGTRMVSLEEA
jgi:uncharacterized spore protein YtfJ